MLEVDRDKVQRIVAHGEEDVGKDSAGSKENERFGGFNFGEDKQSREADSHVLELNCIVVQYDFAPHLPFKFS